MICEKCGKEIPENETICPCCSEEEPVLEQPEETVAPAEEAVLEDISMEEMSGEDAFDPEELGIPVSTVVRKKRGKARVIFGIISLVIMAALIVVSFLNPVLIIGEWKSMQTVSTGYTPDLQLESVMSFKASGELVLSEMLTNYEELGYPAEDALLTNRFHYSIAGNQLNLEMIPEEGQTAQSVEMLVDVTPGMFSYWQGGQTPRQVYDYQRDGMFYPSMYLWLASAALLILGVLLLAIPGKKYEITTCEDVLEGEDEFEEFLEEIYEEIEADPEDIVSEEGLEQAVVEDIAEATETTEE